MEHNLSDTNFFGTEKIGKILLKIAPPVMIAQLIQALYNILSENILLMRWQLCLLFSLYSLLSLLWQ